VQGKIIELVENGVDFSVWRSDSSLSKAASRQVHFIFLGRLLDWKAVDLLLEAFAAVVAPTDEVLEIIGDGDIRGELEAQTARLGIDSSVPADYLNSICGILVEPASKEGFVKGLTEAMLKLTQSPELLQSMGCAGRERVREHFDWERKVDRILEIYQQTIDACPKPWVADY
jgi:glycosyltransferase involved in cell wall biosynthesis